MHKCFHISVSFVTHPSCFIWSDQQNFFKKKKKSHLSLNYLGSRKSTSRVDKINESQIRKRGTYLRLVWSLKKKKKKGGYNWKKPNCNTYLEVLCYCGAVFVFSGNIIFLYVLLLLFGLVLFYSLLFPLPYSNPQICDDMFTKKKNIYIHVYKTQIKRVSDVVVVVVFSFPPLNLWASVIWDSTPPPVLRHFTCVTVLEMDQSGRRGRFRYPGSWQRIGGSVRFRFSR